MATLKCKMCGGDLQIAEGMTVAECEYCGTKQTVPNVDNEKKLTLFGRANRLRMACEFDKAAGVYESIVAEFPEEAEAYWGLVLCRYGIEYVDDPATGKKIPTCHRSSFDSVMEDSDFEQACENADAVARRVYREEAKAIEDIRRGIIEVSGKEAPYDIFICYKETDENGDRTIDSAIAQDVYDALTDKGYRVFFSRITLEDKLGQEYEPYIFAALNSAKIMLAFGTDYEYFNAVWVKNEWSRFLKLMAADKSKHLIPCYKGIDAYDMPKEFARLQAQDMGKVGAIQDLLRGIEKILPRKQPETVKETVVVQQAVSAGPTVDSYLKRGNMALEDGNFNEAKKFFNEVLNIDPENGHAYLGLDMAAMSSRTQQEYADRCVERKYCGYSDQNYKRAKQFADPELAAWLTELETKIERQRREEEEAAARKVARKAAQKAAQEEAIRATVERMAEARRRIMPAQGLLSTTQGNYTAARKTDGTWLCTDRKLGAKLQEDVVVEQAGGDLLFKLDDTFQLANEPSLSAKEIDTWRDLKTVVAAGSRVLGLHKDGTVVMADYMNKDKPEAGVKNWHDVCQIATGRMYSFGLTTAGKVYSTGRIKFAVQTWEDIVAIDTSVGYEDPESPPRNVLKAKYQYRVAGLRSDGRVLLSAVSGDVYGVQREIQKWRNIVAISCGASHMVGLKADGTVVAAGYHADGRCDVGEWTDIVAVYAGDAHTVGLKTDGTLVAVGQNAHGECNVAGWKLFNSMDTLEQERAEAKRREEEVRARQKEERRLAAEKQKAALQTELANLKGLFTGKRRREIEARLAEIDAELKNL